MTAAKFRRPAILEAEDAEQIVGDADPAEGSELAHATALVLLGRESGTPLDKDDRLNLETLVQVVQNQGVEVVSELWSRSPASTLPGTLWRLYLIGQWWQRDPLTVDKRLREGAEVLAGVDLDQALQLGVQVRAGIERLLSGGGVNNLAALLRATATLIRIMAEGATYGANWITDQRDELADSVTIRHSALRVTASELVTASHREEIGDLD